MPKAEIITIGTELLLGEILDTNSQYLARALRENGIDLYRMVTTGDNAARTANAIQEAMERAEIVITTGGLGPTVDDPTREAVALALNTQTVFYPQLWEQIQARFQRYNRIATDNNKKQAFIPKGAIPIENPVGTAPAFIFDTGGSVVISLPGVPSEMVFLMENSILSYLKQRFVMDSVYKTRTLHTVGVGESQIDAIIGDLEALSNPTVGLAAHAGQVDVRITVKAKNENNAYELMEPIESTLRQRLGEWIYGIDQDTLEMAALQPLIKRKWFLVAIEAGLRGKLISRLAKVGSPFIRGEVLAIVPEPDVLLKQLREYRKIHKAEVAIGTAIYPTVDKIDAITLLITPAGEKSITRSYGGPPEYAPNWAHNISLDLLRGI